MQTRSQKSLNTDKHWAITVAAACSVLFVLLVSLAIVQYRWLAELRLAERRQLELSLKATADRFAREFVGELLRVVTAFQLEYRSSQSLPEQLKDAYEQWVGSASHPDLISELLLVRSRGQQLETLRFDRHSGELHIIQRNDLDQLLEQLARYTAFQSSAGTRTVYPKNPIFLEDISALAVPFVLSERYQVESRRRVITIEQRDVPAWSVVRLDQSLVVDQLLPRLFTSHFAVSEPPPYRIAVVSAEQPRRIFYQSEPFSDDDLNTADLVLDLLPEIGGELKRVGPQPIGIVAPETPQWRLYVKHRMGSVDDAVQNLHSRNLGIGLSILLVLATGLVLVIISASRARRLARTQVEFAAAVSHELRTPLAVIRAAAYNLEEGVAVDRVQIRFYAGLVKDAGRRLSKMVDQILLFTETQSTRRKVVVLPVNVSDVIENALDAVSATGSDRSWKIERYIEPDLPMVLADPVLLSHCIQNLVSNAVKYGNASDSRPVRITALRDPKKTEVQIWIADEGSGIDQSDLPHIFEPFYRGSNVDRETGGTGLGLALVERLIVSQGGSVSVKTAPAVGSTFVLHIPANDAGEL